MYRVQGIKNAFKKAAAVTTGVRLIGQLIHLTAAGEASTTTSAIHFPLTEKFDGAADHLAAAQVDGIAKVYVETAASIVAGSYLKAGATGLGAALAGEGDAYFARALETPSGNGSYIPAVLVSGVIPEPA